MKLLIDPVGGLSGDMFVGAVLDLGLGLEDLRSIYRKVVGDVDVDVSRGSIGLRVRFYDDRRFSPDDMLRAIEESGLPSAHLAKEALELIVKAESSVHGKSSPHLHELGNIDTLLDIVGALEGLYSLGYTEFYAFPVPVSWGGSIDSSHGPLPNPAPATLHILSGVPLRVVDGPESVTPTGAAIFKVLSPSFDVPQPFVPKAQGIGEGEREMPGRPNVLRLVGFDVPWRGEDAVYSLETNIDDMNTEVYPYLMGALMDVGVLDVSLIHATMKKGRPGFILKVLVGEGHLNQVVEFLLRETTTLGVRVSREKRVVLRREEGLKEVMGEDVKAKRVVRVDLETEKVEMDDLKRLWLKKGVPLWILRKRY